MPTKVALLTRLTAVCSLLLGSMYVMAGPAQAASEIAPIPAGGFKLSLDSDSTSAVNQGEAANPQLGKVGLTTLAGSGTSGQDGLCYPAPFNPGVDADGYCWKNDDADDSGTNGWSPQGLSVPHNDVADGSWEGHLWDVVSWHNEDNTLAKLRFVSHAAATPRYTDVLLTTLSADGKLTPLASHADSVVWYKDNLLVGNGRYLHVFRLTDLMRATNRPSGFDYVLPRSYLYRTPSDGNSSCQAVTGDAPCLTSLSFDRSTGALLSSEYVQKAAGGRLVEWPLDLSTGLPRTGNGNSVTASAAWTSPVWGMQGAVYTQGSFFLSGLCPSSFDTGYRESACVHKAGRGEAPHVLTAVPDMTQNLDWDGSSGRVRGINEVAQSTQVLPQRLVFNFSPTARSIETVRIRNVNSDKCLLPYGSSLNDGANVVQWDCNGTSAQNWYWDGSRIRNFQSNRCLSVYGRSTSDGAQITQWRCNGDATQNWSRASGTAGGSVLVNGGSNLCLTIYGRSTSNGANSVQWTCQPDHTDHNWTGSGT
ncbi:RICIN domain-containing protein [Streptomyces avermitilis]|uniref:RICIN domain-containing protein n=1 Tax=Streptomyces avermitilis TaxID=33903 RepID=UPI0033C80619